MTVATLGYTMVICGNSDDPQHRYRGRIEKVKFGVPIEEAFAHDIPATLLVLLLKVHKDGPAKKDIWRAPGNQAQVRKLSHIMQHGRLVNIANFSVYTAASVIKKFLSKLPGGIFGLENEQKLFDLYNISSDMELQRQSFCRVLSSLPVPSQHLLVLLFGTFYMISESADSFGSRMTTEALGISVAPSLFHSCIHDGQRAKMEDVIRFKIASEIISRIIENFGYANLFPRESYEFYARITGRALRFDENDSRLRFVTPANVHNRPVPPPTTYSIMAARCVGSYSMGTVAAIDRISSNCDDNEVERTLLTSTISLQSEQGTSDYPYMTIADCKSTFFGIGPQHITVATVADDELISKNEKLILRPSNSQIAIAFANEHQSLPNHLRNTQVSTDLDLELCDSENFDF
ncbi:RhoGAP domain family protein [Acanthocheilonema viteae]|uniref:Rho-GAP domain-containing protein n=1 Tax=Acanthocheilonema viteae TaxID=6277 RepID=A0A498SH90_ACAVI|nr:unnamed protein product [Acanthocheilonema viteae]